MSIGDIHSNEKGTGARYNSGKTDYSLMPISILSDSFPDETDHVVALKMLGLYQEIQDTKWLMRAFNIFDQDCSGMIKVLEYGKNTKYVAWNWLKGMPWSVPLACAVRHLLCVIMEGQENDIESGLKHEWHFKCNVMFLMQYAKSYPEGNDLPPKELFSDITYESNQVVSGSITCSADDIKGTIFDDTLAADDTIQHSLIGKKVMAVKSIDNMTPQGTVGTVFFNSYGGLMVDTIRFTFLYNPAHWRLYDANS